MTEQQKRKQHIRAFMRAHYTDERLAQLLAHAQDGKLIYTSCCCFIGVATAAGRLAGKDFDHDNGHSLHFLEARKLCGAEEAEDSFLHLEGGLFIYGDDVRRRILIPMIRAEMKRRAALAAPAEVSVQDQRVAEPMEMERR